VDEESCGEEEEEDSDAMMGVPGAVLLAPSGGEGGGFEGGDAVVDGDEDEESVDDDRYPEDCGCGEPEKCWLVEAQAGFRGHEDEADHVPDGHGFAQPGGEEAQGFGLGWLVELPDDGVYEEGDGDFVAGHESCAEDGC